MPDEKDKKQWEISKERDSKFEPDILKEKDFDSSHGKELPKEGESLFSRKRKQGERVLEDITNDRNIGIIAHIDAGKTTTTELILYHAGEIHRIGKVHDKEKGVTMDYMVQERERGITIQSAATTVYWKKHKINIIDTPGHVDFTVEVERCLRVLDGSVVVIDGKEGVEAQTETVWNQANKYKIPRLVFINKMDGVDNVENRFAACCQSLQDRLGAKLLICQFPIGEYNGIEGIIDLIEEKAYYFQGDQEENYQVKIVPFNYLKKLKEYRQMLIEKVIEYDEGLALKYLEGQEISSSEVKYLIRKAVISMNHFAIFCGSAYKHVGVKLLLDGVVDYLPSPLDRSMITVFSNQEEKTIPILETPYALGLAFKIMKLDFIGKLTFVRVYSGKISANTYIYNVNKKKKEKVSRLVRMHANKQEEVSEVKMGDIAAIVGLKYTATGDTLSSEEEDILLEPINFMEPVISLAIEPKTKKDQDELSKSLKSLAEEDPTFRYSYNPETRQMIISGMGELHLEILVDRLKNEYGIDINVGKPQVAYCETIKNVVELEYTHRKQSGGAGQYAKVKLRFEPNPGKGFEFAKDFKGELIGKGNCFVSSVEKGLLSAFAAGPLLKYPMVDIKTTLLGGGYHEVDSSDNAFRIAGQDSFRENAHEFEIALLEPIMKLQVGNIPENSYGVVLASITSKRGIVESIEKRLSVYVMKAKIPLAETFNYSTVLRSLTEGRGTHSLEFSHYQEVPKLIVEQMLNQNSSYDIALNKANKNLSDNGEQDKRAAKKRKKG